MLNIQTMRAMLNSSPFCDHSKNSIVMIGISLSQFTRIHGQSLPYVLPFF